MLFDYLVELSPRSRGANIADGPDPPFGHVAVEERALAMANGEAGNTQIVMLGLRNHSRAATGWNNDTVKLEHTGPEGGPLQIEPTHKIDIAALEPEQRDQLREILVAAKALGIKEV